VCGTKHIIYNFVEFLLLSLQQEKMIQGLIENWVTKQTITIATTFFTAMKNAWNPYQFEISTIVGTPETESGV
jgi:hypothetical protein